MGGVGDEQHVRQPGLSHNPQAVKTHNWSGREVQHSASQPIRPPPTCPVPSLRGLPPFPSLPPPHLRQLDDGLVVDVAVLGQLGGVDLQDLHAVDGWRWWVGGWRWRVVGALGGFGVADTGRADIAKGIPVAVCGGVRKGVRASRLGAYRRE